ncbi:DMT family transporter [Rubritalea sp.]|uniref:DMT family transporter n=1 Tax=Rubritalea sp. TaxID=2109375 RepID=UPI003EF8FBF0
MSTQSKLQLSACTLIALLAFAGNSVLGRLALSDGSLDPTSFTVIRLWSGALVLTLLLKTFPTSTRQTSKGSWQAALMLFLYAATFSYAYQSLTTGTGALILFGAVQLTVIFTSILKGQKLQPIAWLGMAVAFLGFIYLVTPGLSAPPLVGFSLMVISGVAWANYTLLGSGSRNPLSDTAHNFLRTIPLSIPLIIFYYQDISLTQKGVWLACASGAITSGLGYAIWYLVLKKIKPLSAAVIQLLVPVLASIGGVLFAKEALTLHFVIASTIILGGAATVILANAKKPVR